MMRSIGAALLVPALVAATPAPGPRAAIEAVLSDSAAGWNMGDLDRFVAIYAPDATFVTPTGLIQGRAGIAAHYRPGFVPGGNARGRLDFAILAIRSLSVVHQLVFARYRLTAADGKVTQGPTTLLFERRREGWRIVADHSS